AGEVGRADGAPDADPRAQVGDAGPGGDLVDRGVGDRLDGGVARAVDAAVPEGGVRRHRDEDEEVLLAAGGDGRVGAGGGAHVRRGGAGHPTGVDVAEVGPPVAGE